jgi:hypothetical protein
MAAVASKFWLAQSHNSTRILPPGSQPTSVYFQITLRFTLSKIDKVSQ